MAGERINLTIRNNDVKLTFTPYRTMDGKLVNIYVDDKLIMKEVEAHKLVSVLNGIKD